jgi:RecB family exonuclease
MPAPASRVERLSYTTLAELERCGYRYYLQRVLGLRERDATGHGGEGGSLPARARGTLVHAVLAQDIAADTEPAFAQALQRRAGALGLALSGPERDELARLLAAVAHTPLYARIADAAEVHRELPFAFALGADEPLVTGVIDALAREPDGLLVVDYKTDRVGDADLAELVRRDYEVQRLVYALAVLRDPAVEAVDVVHWYLQRPREPVIASYVAGEREALQSALAGRAGRVLEHPFRVSPLPHRGLCETCPGRARLCSWDAEHTLRDAPAQPAPAGGTDTA